MLFSGQKHEAHTHGKSEAAASKPVDRSTAIFFSITFVAMIAISAFEMVRGDIG